MIHIQQRNDASKWAQFTTNTLYTDNTGWWTIPVTFIQEGGGGSLTNLTDCLFTFVNQNGPKDTIWNNVILTSGSMSVNNGYLANNAELVTLLLPPTVSSTITDIIKIKGYGAAGFKISQNASQVIILTEGGIVGTNLTTAGITGYIQSTGSQDYIELMYVAANTWSVMGMKGTFTLH